MLKTVFIKPVSKGLVRDPISKIPLKETGEKKLLSTFWRRRLKQGDVIEVDVSKTKPISKEKEKIK